MKIILLIFFITGLIISIIAWLFDKDGCNVILSFEKFHRYWKKNPDNWILRPGWARYFVYDLRHCVNYNVCFSFIGWIQYHLWKIFLKKFERDKSLRKTQTEFEKLMEDET